MKLKKTLLWVSILFSFSPLYSSDDAVSYKEIPYYLNQLETTDLEEKRLEDLKKIHDAVVNADLLDKKTVKSMMPMIENLMRSMDSGFDRPYISGSFYLASAVDFFEKQKLRPQVNVPESDWLGLQSKRGENLSLSTYPDKILLHSISTTTVVVTNTHIHEAVMSPEARKIAYFRIPEGDRNKAEIWIADVKKKKQKKILSIPSCYTILFSMDGGKIFFQEKPSSYGQETGIFQVSVGGGKPRSLTKGTLLQTLVSQGPYKGNLIIYKKTPHHWGTTDQECPFVVSPSGKEIGRIINVRCK